MKFRPTLSAAILGAGFLCSSFFVMAADDSHPPEPANPEYAQWARFKVGTYVTLERKVLEHGENNVGVVEAMARALEQGSDSRPLRRTFSGPLIKGKGRPGPRFPKDETPYDLLLP